MTHTILKNIFLCLIQLYIIYLKTDMKRGTHHLHLDELKLTWSYQCF